MGRRRRAPVPALHLGRGAPRPRRRRGVGQHRARRPRPDDRRRGRSARCRRRCSRPRRPRAATRASTTAAGPVPIRFRPTLAHAPVTQSRPARSRRPRGARSPPALAADLAALTFSPLLHDWLDERGFASARAWRSSAAATTMWSVSDGVTVAVLRADGGHADRVRRVPRRRPRRSPPTRDAAGPAVSLEGTLLGGTEPWSPQVDLLGSTATRPSSSSRSRTTARRRCASATTSTAGGPRRAPSFTATYRVGNGVAGNVGAGAIAHVVTLNGAITGATNPLPAAAASTRRRPTRSAATRPRRILVQERAVTADDYAERERARPARAARGRDLPLDRLVAHGLRHRRPRRRRSRSTTPSRPSCATSSSRTGWPATTSRSTGRTFVAARASRCTSASGPDYFRAHVQAAVLDVLSSGVRADGTLGLFHPDRFTFGEPVYLSADRRRRAGGRRVSSR